MPKMPIPNMRYLLVVGLVLFLVACSVQTVETQQAELQLTETVAPTEIPTLQATTIDASPTKIAPTETPIPMQGMDDAEPTATAAEEWLFDGISHGITAEGFPYLGNPEAPVTVIDYSDFL